MSEKLLVVFRGLNILLVCRWLHIRLTQQWTITLPAVSKHPVNIISHTYRFRFGNQRLYLLGSVLLRGACNIRWSRALIPDCIENQITWFSFTYAELNQDGLADLTRIFLSLATAFTYHFSPSFSLTYSSMPTSAVSAWRNDRVPRHIKLWHMVKQKFHHCLQPLHVPPTYNVPSSLTDRAQIFHDHCKQKEISIL